MRTAPPNSKTSIARAHAVEGALQSLQVALRGLLNAPEIHPDTRQRLARLGEELGQRPIGAALERVLDELDAVPRGRVDTDHLSVNHGAITCFELWNRDRTQGAGFRRSPRNTGDDRRLIARFMQAHRGIEIEARRVPFGGAGESFSITGTKAARKRFVEDPRWPKLQRALEDIYRTDHSGGYADDLARLRRQIPDPAAYVFGGGR